MSKVAEIQFYDVNDVMKMTGVAQTKAYEIIKNMNQELEDKGKLTIRGKIHKKYFDEKVSI